MSGFPPADGAERERHNSGRGLPPAVTVLGIDDTDSRTAGMCSTYLAALAAEAIEDAGDAVHRRLLVRLNPAVEHKTRGNAALALHTDAAPEDALALASDLVERFAVDADQSVGVVDPGIVATDLTGGKGRDPADVADMFRWAALECPTDDLNGAVVGLREWKQATR